MGRFADLLRNLNPINGYIINSRGYPVNRADIMQRQDAAFDVFNQLQVAEYTPMIERSPRPGFSVLRDRTVPAGETINIVNGELEVDGTAAKRALYTRKLGRYLPGLIAVPGLRFRVADPSTGHYEYGYGDEFGNRMGVEWDGGEVFTFVESAGDRYYRQPRSQWLDPLDGTGPSGVDVDINGLTLRMPFGWYGGLLVRFDFAVPDREAGDRLVTADRSSTDQLQDGVTLREPNLPIFAEADGGIGYVGGRQFGVYGRYNPEFRVTSTGNVQKSVGTTYEPVVSLKVKDDVAFRGVPVIVGGAGILASENTEWAIFIDPDLTGAEYGSISGVPDGETALEIDTSATALSGGYRVYSDTVIGGQGNRSGQGSVNLPDFNIPSDGIITLAARGINVTADVDATLRVLEEN